MSLIPTPMTISFSFNVKCYEYETQNRRMFSIVLLVAAMFSHPLSRTKWYDKCNDACQNEREWRMNFDIGWTEARHLKVSRTVSSVINNDCFQGHRPENNWLHTLSRNARTNECRANAASNHDSQTTNDTHAHTQYTITLCWNTKQNQCNGNWIFWIHFWLWLRESSPLLSTFIFFCKWTKTSFYAHMYQFICMYMCALFPINIYNFLLLFARCHFMCWFFRVSAYSAIYAIIIVNQWSMSWKYTMPIGKIEN